MEECVLPRVRRALLLSPLIHEHWSTMPGTSAGGSRSTTTSFLRSNIARGERAAFGTSGTAAGSLRSSFLSVFSSSFSSYPLRPGHDSQRALRGDAPCFLASRTHFCILFCVILCLIYVLCSVRPPHFQPAFLKSLRTYGCGDIGTGDTLDWGIQVVESLALNDLSANLRANTESGETTLDSNETTPTKMSYLIPCFSTQRIEKKPTG